MSETRDVTRCGLPLEDALRDGAVDDRHGLFTRSVALAALLSTAVRAFFTAVRSDAIAARLRARCLIILRFCFSADLILATYGSLEG